MKLFVHSFAVGTKSLPWVSEVLISYPSCGIPDRETVAGLPSPGDSVTHPEERSGNWRWDAGEIMYSEIIQFACNINRPSFA